MINKLLPIAIISVLAGCSSKSAPAPASLEVISPKNGAFCDTHTKAVRQGGGMYVMGGGSTQFVGSCQHRLINRGEIILIYIGTPPVNLFDDLNYYLNPSEYYTAKEIAEMDCTEGSECMAAKMAEQARVEARAQLAAWTKEQLKHGAIVNFDSGKAEPKDFDLLKRIAEGSNGQKISIIVVGHTDSKGSNGLNNKLSQERAERVRQILAGFGADPQMIQVSSRGEAEPIADNKTEAGRALNRRVDVKGVNDGN